MFRCRAHLDEQRPHLQPRAARGTEGAVLLSARARAHARERRAEEQRGGAVARAAASKRSIATWCPAPFAARLVTSALRRATSSRSSLSSNCSRPFSRCKAGGTEIARRSFVRRHIMVCVGLLYFLRRGTHSPLLHTVPTARTRFPAAAMDRMHGEPRTEDTLRRHAQACAPCALRPASAATR